MRPTIMEIDVVKFKNNVKKIQEYVGDKVIMPVVKANAYGTYLNKNIDVMNDFSIVAVATVDEGVELIKDGYQGEVFVLNQPSIMEIDTIVSYPLIIGLSDKNFLKEVIKRNCSFKVHLEIETGMNRTGIAYGDYDQFIELLKQSNLIVDGIYTHFSSADFDMEYTNQQIDKFKRAVTYFKSIFSNIRYIHSSASNGILNCNDGISNLVRPGLILYGYEPYEGASSIIPVDGVAALKSKIIFLKELDEGESISYSRTYQTRRKSLIATIPIGYADGFRRVLSNRGYVLVNGKKAPIVGSVCMDSCMIDVTDISSVEVGTDVYLWDNEALTIEEFASLCNSFSYEILCTIGNRVNRVFK